MGINQLFFLGFMVIGTGANGAYKANIGNWGAPPGMQDDSDMIAQGSAMTCSDIVLAHKAKLFSMIIFRWHI